MRSRWSTIVRPWRWSLGWQAAFLAVALIGAFSSSFALRQRTYLLPGETSDGHHVIEAACDACHAGGGAPANAACRSCHAAELAADTHPTTTFEDPRWAAELDTVDARRCPACHAEHARNPRSVSAPRDLCFGCHDDVIEKRESHRAFAADSCMDGGCHNYHDNRTLTAAFIAKRLAQPATHTREQRLAWRSPEAPLATREVPAAIAGDRQQAAFFRWEHSAHARASVACKACHEASGTWIDAPDEGSCRGCHAYEVDSFRGGKHGMRGALGLPPLAVSEARRPMRADAAHALQGCGACHDVHAADTDRAATVACLGCHDDEHSRAQRYSPHASAGVTCATCHLPRIEVRDANASTGKRVAVMHDNGFTLEPRDRMARVVCVQCHGIELALSALYDEASVRSSFARPPAGVHPSIEMVRRAQATQPGSGNR